MIVQYSVSLVDAVSRKVRIEVSQEYFLRQLNTFSNAESKTYDFLNYEPLSVPPSILQAALEALISNALSEVSKKERFRIVSRRSLNIEPLKPHGNVFFSATVAIYPKPLIRQYDTIEYRIAPIDDVSEEDVNEAIELLREGQTGNLPCNLTYCAAKEDQIDLSFTLTIANLTSPVTRIRFNFAQEIFPEEVEKALVGAKAGEDLSISLTFPIDHPIASQRGQSGTYNITIHSLLKRVKPELNDQFASGLLIDGVNSLSDLKSWVRKHLEFIRISDNLTRLQSAILDEILDRNYFEVPVELVEDEMRGLLLELRKISPVDATNPGFSVGPFYGEFGREALRRVRVQILLDSIARQENLQPSEPDLMRFDSVDKSRIADEILDNLRTQALDILLANWRKTLGERGGVMASGNLEGAIDTHRFLR